jgi:hypothetical protein
MAPYFWGLFPIPIKKPTKLIVGLNSIPGKKKPVLPERLSDQRQTIV